MEDSYPLKSAYIWVEIVNNCVPTRLLIHHHVISSEEEASFPVCKEDQENIPHLFLKCSFVVEVSNKVCLWLDIQFPCYENIVDHFLWLGKECIGKKAPKVKHIILACDLLVYLARKE